MGRRMRLGLRAKDEGQVEARWARSERRATKVRTNQMREQVIF